LLFDEFEHGCELGEEEDAAVLGKEGVEEVEEVGEFSGGVFLWGLFFVLGKFEEVGVAADLAELEEGVEDGELGLFEAAGGDGFTDFFVHGGADGFVEIALVGSELDGVGEDGFGRELRGDLVFGAAKDEGGEAFAEGFAAFFTVFFFDRCLVVGAELFPWAEEAGDEEAHE